jgi:YidC/Oxa1 family membrane protein insertase
MIDKTQPEGATKALIQPIEGSKARFSFVYPIQGSEILVKQRYAFAEKKKDILSAIEPTLDHVIDFGWLKAIAYPLLAIMKWFYSQFPNWGVAIILLTLLVKLATFPLTYKSMVGMKKMAALQPELKKIQEKYKDDKDALNREMMVMMREKGYNPLAGCLPIFLQMPIFFALYRVLYSAVELYQAPFFSWIHDLSSKDPYFVLPVLLTGTMVLQQKLTPNTVSDPVQQKMMTWMPVIFGVMMLQLPAGLSLYMLVNALAGILQQFILNKKVGPGPVVSV